MNIDPAAHVALHLRGKTPTAPDTLEPPQAWMDDAACLGHTTDTFYPDRQGASARPAKTICAGCPVTVECLTYALRIDDRWGVMGGLSARERRGLTRKENTA